MSLVLAIADVKPEHIRNRKAKPNAKSSSGSHTDFFKSSAERPNDPAAFLVQYGAGGSSSAHYHIADQFQILVNGEGTFGRHHVAPYSVHFSRAYTPYGPLNSDGGWGFLTLRASYDPGSTRDFEALKQMPGRQPWQVTGQADFPEQGKQAAAKPISEIKDDNGLFVTALTVPANGQMVAPNPIGNGQYVVAVKGSLIHEGKEHKALTVVFLKPNEPAFQIHAGAEGVEVLVLNFPSTSAPQAKVNKGVASGSKKWQCELCSFFYDEALGMPNEGVAAGTRWEDVPESWTCPDCAAGKSDFKMIEVH